MPLVFFGLTGPVVPRILEQGDICVQFLNCCEEFVSFGIIGRDTNAVGILADKTEAVLWCVSGNVKQE